MLLWAKLANPNVLVNSDGKVFAFRRHRSDNANRTRSLCFNGEMIELKGFTTNNGYLSVHINKRKYLVHRLVAKSFLGECPEGLEVDHKDRNKLNNALSNLHYVTRAENSNNRDYVEFAKCNQEGFKGYGCKKGYYKTTRNGKTVYLRENERRFSKCTSR